MTDDWTARFATLSTPLIADACLRLRQIPRIAPAGLRPLVNGMRAAGRAAPVRHYGSVDIFLEALSLAQPGDVLVIDNGGRQDEGCIGDLTALETLVAGLSGMVVWGLHRDTDELLDIDLPIFTYGAFPGGPLRLDAREADALVSARIGSLTVTGDDIVFADSDGVVFVNAQHVEAVMQIAADIQARERRQADLVRGGHTLRDQFQFDQYLTRRAADPTYTLRQHLQVVGGAIET